MESSARLSAGYTVGAKKLSLSPRGLVNRIAELLITSLIESFCICIPYSILLGSIKMKLNLN